MAKNYDALADSVIQLVGGKDNITYLTHCITRLRFNVKDRALIKEDEVKALSGVLGAQWSGEQFQVVIGQEVEDVYSAVCIKAGLSGGGAVDENLDAPAEKKKFTINTLFETLSACMVPVLPALCAAGVIKGILLMLTTYAHVSTESGLYILLNTIGDLAFYFLPFLVAVSASKKFNTNTVLAMMLAGLFLHPNISGLAGSDLNVFGLNVHILNYSSTVFPIIISVFVMSYVYKFIDSKIPKVLRFVLSPALTILVMAPICLGVVGPFGYYLGQFVATGVNKIFNLNAYIGGLVLGLIRPFVLLTGMQTTFTPIILNNMTVLGYDFIWPVHCIFAMCCCGISFGSFLKSLRSKNPEITSQKENFLSSFVSAFAGVSEPTLYGNVFRYKTQLVALLISSGICGALTGGLGAKAISPANPPWLFLVQFGDTAGLMAIMFVVAFLVSAVASYLMGFGEIKFFAKRRA